MYIKRLRQISVGVSLLFIASCGSVTGPAYCLPSNECLVDDWSCYPEGFNTGFQDVDPSEPYCDYMHIANDDCEEICDEIDQCKLDGYKGAQATATGTSGTSSEKSTNSVSSDSISCHNGSG